MKYQKALGDPATKSGKKYKEAKLYKRKSANIMKNLEDKE